MGNSKSSRASGSSGTRMFVARETRNFQTQPIELAGGRHA